MNVYTVIKEFSAPTLGLRLEVGTLVDKVISASKVIVDGIESTNKAFFDWVGSVDSQPYLEFTSVEPDPPTGSAYAGVGGAASIPNGVDYLEVTGLDFGYIPVSIIVSVFKPDGTASNIFATVRMDSITAIGFTVDFSSPIPGDGYSVAYFAAPLAGQGAPATMMSADAVAIPSGVLSLGVSKAFGFIPDTVIVSITKPDVGSSNIFATVKSDSITSFGFNVDLSATTGSTGYVLNYLVKSGGY